MCFTGMFKGKKFIFKESYSIIPSLLKEFPWMLQPESGEEEAFPSQYYSSDLLKNGNRKSVITDTIYFLKEEEPEKFVEVLTRSRDRELVKIGFV
jgi:hypothetical protein